MAVPKLFQGRLALPAIAAPLFLVSCPDLVVATCCAGVVGSFPALNQRTTEGLDGWLSEIRARLHPPVARPHAPYGVNLIVHRSNARLAADLEVVVKHRVPLVITSLGAVADVVAAVQSYGGLVFHDVISTRHAEKAVAAGVDGIIAVCAGAGGHAGRLSPFALVPEIRSIFAGTIVLSGALSTGAHVAAARLIGADLGYLGTRFIATTEAAAVPGYKDMILGAAAADIVYTPAISGVHGNYLRPSLVAAGLDPDALPAKDRLELSNPEGRAWKNIWSAGQGVGSVTDLLSAGELCARLAAEYRAAVAGLT